MKVAIYCRISQEDRKKFKDDDDSESIQNQKNLLTNYIVSKGWELYNIYVDDDYSGMDSNRPSFKRMLEDARLRLFDIILCKSQSRFTRDMSLVEEYINDKLIQWNIRFITLVDYADNFVKGNRKQRQINGLVNQWYIEDTSDSIRAVLDHKRKEGCHIGGTARFGYIKDSKNKGKILIDPIASKIVKDIFNMAENGLSTVQIARKLNEDNVLKPTVYKQMYIKSNYKSAGMKTNKWYDKTVRLILREPMYIGDMVQGRTTKISIRSYKKRELPKEKWIIKKGTHEPIISLEQFNKVQKMLDSRSKVSHSEGKKHIFSGKLICSKCGGKLKKLKNGSGNYYFKCSRSISPICECSPRVQILSSKLEMILRKRVNDKINQYCNFDEIEYSLNNSEIDNEIKMLYKEKEKISLELEKKSNTLVSLYSDKVSGLINDNEFIQLKKGLNTQKEEIETEIKRLEKNIEELIEKKNSYQNNKEIAEQFKNFDELDIEIINAFIESIVIGEKPNKSENIPQVINVNWNF